MQRSRVGALLRYGSLREPALRKPPTREGPSIGNSNCR